MSPTRQNIFGFVIFPEVIKYFDEFADSVIRQTDSGFEILVISENIDLNIVKNKFRNYKMHCIEKTKSNIAENRMELILYAKKLKADNIIFGDCDDYFSQNRIANTKEHLKKYDIVFNELELFGQGIEKKKVIGNRISYESDFEKEILTKNFIGFSNSGFNLKIVEKDFFIPDDIKAVDWWVYSYLMLKNSFKVFFDSTAITYYRQHAGNIIGWNKHYSKENYMFQADEKIKHYKYLANLCPKYEGNIKMEMQKTIDFQKSISGNDYFNRHKDYTSKLSKKINLLWWEHLQAIENFKGVCANGEI